MNDNRDFGAELDELRVQLNELQRLLGQQQPVSRNPNIHSVSPSTAGLPERNPAGTGGSIYFSGYFHNESGGSRWEPQERSVQQLLSADGEKMAKILAALGHIQRLDILRMVLEKPHTGTELVERLNMGTTGQLYHHIKALAGADLLLQEERGGSYTIPPHRTLPLLVLLAAVSELLDTSDYMAMTDTRSNASAYLGKPLEKYDPHLLLWAVLENSILEHQYGSCSDIHIFIHDSRHVTVADNGRGIPLGSLSPKNKSWVQTIMTDLDQLGTRTDPYTAPGAEKGISIAVVNAMALHLQVEVRREGRIYRQSYRHGIPQTALLEVGTTQETGASITLEPDSDLFDGGFDAGTIGQRVHEISAIHPALSLHLHDQLNG